jgi:transposase
MCPRAIFTERLPALARPYARRTARQAKALTCIGVALGGEAAARLSSELALTVSADTLLRLVRHAEVDAVPPPRVVGVDDWAIRRGHQYGTILVDLERHAPIDLLADRSAESLAHWMQEHPGIEVVARDRSDVYAQGARVGAPDAVQVADRWHLLKNAGEALERVTQRNRAALERAANDAAAEAAASTDTTPSGVGASTEEQTESEPGAQSPRQALYERLHTLRAQGASIRRLCELTGVSRPTVRKYLRADQCPERAPRRTKIGSGTDHDAYLRARWEQGCRDALVLWRELSMRGFRGTARTVQRHVEPWRLSEAQAKQITAPRPAPRPPSPRELRWWLLKPTSEQPPEQARYVKHLVESCPAIANSQHLAQDFADILRTRATERLGPWLEEAAACSVAEFRDFAAGLRRDLRAVEAALAYSWSNGQTEGQITKLKMLKRQMYGRASVPLLRQRLLLAA